MPTLLHSTSRWLLLGALFAVAAFGMHGQSVDPANRSLKDPGSADAEALRALAEVVPDEPVLLLGFATRGGLEMAAADRERLEALRQQLASVHGVRSATAAPLADAGLVLHTLAIASDDAYATCERLVATADAGAPPTVTVHATGLPLIEGAIASRIAAERTVVVPLVVLVLLLATGAIYRRPSLVAAVLLPPLAAIATLGGVIGWLGHSLDPVSCLLDPLLLTIGVAGATHFVQAHHLAQAEGLSGHAAAASAARAMLHPAFLASGTTMLGLWSVAISRIPAVTDFGIRGALGVALIHAFLFWLLPPWLARFAPRGRPAPATVRAAPRLAHLARWRLPILLTATALTVGLGCGLVRLRGDNQPLLLLPTSERARADHDLLAARLGGVELCHVLVPPRSAAAEPSRLLPFVADASNQPGVAGVAGSVSLGAGGALAVPLLLQPGGSARRVPLFDGIERTARAFGFDDVVVAGPAVQIARDSDRLLTSLGGSLGLGVLALGATMAFGLRSLRAGLLALVPNLLPAVWIYGALGWLDRPVGVATAMIGTTLLGIIVDNTLHLLHGTRHAPPGTSRGAAVAAALAARGPAIHTSTLVLVLGFLATTVSRLTTTVEFGLLAAATIGIAWFGTAVVLPLVLTTARDTDGVRSQAP